MHYKARTFYGCREHGKGKNVWAAYVENVALAEAVCAFCGWLIRENVQRYVQEMARGLFLPFDTWALVWGVLYALMGVGAARIYLRPMSDMRSYALKTYLWQLVFCFFWPVWLLRFHWYGFALLWLLALWVQIAWMIAAFRQLDRPAAWLQVPYFLWAIFLGYCNLRVCLLN